MSQSKRQEKARQRAVREWQDAPAVNPHYEGATPAEVGRALLRKPACHPEKVEDAPAQVKSGV